LPVAKMLSAIGSTRLRPSSTMSGSGDTESESETSRHGRREVCGGTSHHLLTFRQELLEHCVVANREL